MADHRLTELRRVAQRLSRDHERRDELIREASENGTTRRQVAAAAGLSVGAVQQILRRLGVVVLLALVLLVVPASAADATVIDGRPIYQRWADEARVPTPDTIIRVVEAGCPYSPNPGCSLGDTVWVGDSSLRMFLHELGHQFDHHVLTDPDRAQIMALMRHVGDWMPADAAWQDRPAENFADAYMLCARRTWRRGEWRFPRFEPHPAELSAQRHVKVCQILRVAYQRITS